MKKITLLLLIAIFYVSNCKADQLQNITLEQAQAATELLSQQSTVAIWCSCCKNEQPIMVQVFNVYYKMVDVTSQEPENYTVIIQGINLTENKVFERFIDLAYTHINISGNAVTVAEVLQYNFRKCNEGNTWDENGISRAIKE